MPNYGYVIFFHRQDIWLLTQMLTWEDCRFGSCSHFPSSEMNKIVSSRMILKKKKHEIKLLFVLPSDAYGSLEEESVFLLSLIKLS